MVRVELNQTSLDQIREVVRQNTGIVADFIRANGKNASANALDKVSLELQQTGYVEPKTANAVAMASMEIQVHSNERVMRCMATTMKNLGDAAASRKGLGIEIDGILGLSSAKIQRLGTAIAQALDQRAEKQSPETRFFLLMAGFTMLQEGLLEPLKAQLTQVYMSHKPTPLQDDVNRAVNGELSLLNGETKLVGGGMKSDMRQVRNALAHGDFQLANRHGTWWVSIEDSQSALGLSMTLPGFERFVMDTYYLAYGLMMQIMLAGIGAALHRRLRPPMPAN